jgi:hypothetical protein
MIGDDVRLPVERKRRTFVVRFWLEEIWWGMSWKKGGKRTQQDAAEDRRWKLDQAEAPAQLLSEVVYVRGLSEKLLAFLTYGRLAFLERKARSKRVLLFREGESEDEKASLN